MRVDHMDYLQMKAIIHFPVGSRAAIRLAAVLTIELACLTQNSAAKEPGSAYREGLAAESRLDLFGAREHFREAMRANPQNGWKEHFAWFLYINGFQNKECLDLFQEVLPHASDRNATARAIAHVREVTGQNPPKARPPVPRPSNLPASSGLPAKLQYARELNWSGNHEEAAAALRKLIGRKPEEPALRWELAKVLSAMNQYDEAAEQLTIALERRPKEPEILVDLATVEALRDRRSSATRIIDQAEFSDPAPAQIAKARAHHYCGEFVPAAREYEKAMSARPQDELVAHGLAECRLRNNDIAGAREILSTWSGRNRGINWDDRYSLERELASNRARVGVNYFHNSLDYDRWDAGADLRMRPIDELECGIAVTQGWFDQKSFSSIDRQTAEIYARYQENSYWSMHGSVGVHDYSNGWTSVVGSAGFMIRPVSTLELSLTAEHSDVVDSEPPLGYSIYSMGTTIGAVGGRATMDALTFRASWTPVENTDLFLSYRYGNLTDDNRLNDLYASVSYTFDRNPLFRVGYGLGYTDVEDPSPVYTEGLASTNYYYDPDNRLTHHLFVEYASTLGCHLRYGSECRLILDEDGGAGVGLFAFARYAWNDQHSLRLDTRYFTQNHSRNRNNSTSGHYDAINLTALYEYHF